MSILNKGIAFHDKANGGWYCNDCSQYIHVDMIYSHKCFPKLQASKPSKSSGEPPTLRKLAPVSPNTNKLRDVLWSIGVWEDLSHEQIVELEIWEEALLSAAKIQAYDKAIEDAITRTMGVNDVAVARERIKRLQIKEKKQ